MADKLRRRSSNKHQKSNKSKQRDFKINWNNEQKEIKELEGRYHSIDVGSISKFSDFPLSKRTLQGLTQAGYMNPTDIQKQGIAAALRGCDILGAAKTGSGKTLAFLIPVIEALWRHKWSSVDGLGALIISPTRELAYQTFEVIVKIGCRHDLSAGLVIGGKNLKEEQARINRTNIVVCTPGRLLQHMDETPNFDCSSLKILVLDEADRTLDMGFQTTLNAIVENLPTERQTLLFSATQTKSVKDLARLSLQEPEYIAVHENSTTSTPQRLAQNYVICELPDKLSFLYSFIRNHLKSKTLVFVSSCKQVKFIYESFRRLRPGVPLMALYGKQKQMKRVGIYEEFCKRTHCVLFATDIAARGLDFPAVNWVVQLDCPEDANTYIHRAGRTARYEKDGQSLLVLLPSEEPEMMKALEEKKVPINMIRVNPKKLTSIQSKLEAFCAQDQELKHWAQKSVVSYVRSVFLQSNKKIFDAHQLPVEGFAKSLGLPNAPRIRFLKKAEKKFGSQQTPILSKREASLGGVDVADSDTSQDESDAEDVDTTVENNEGMVTTFTGADDTADQDDSVIFLKKKNVEIVPMPLEEQKTPRSAKKEIVSKIQHVKKIVNKKIKLNSKIIFDDDGMAIQTHGEPSTQKEDSTEEKDIVPVPLGEERLREVGGISVEEARILLQLKDKKDRERERKRIRIEHKKKKRKGKKKEEETGNEVILGHDSCDESEQQSKEDFEPKSKKQKRRQKSESNEDENDNSRLSLMEDEELALHFLQQTR